MNAAIINVVSTGPLVVEVHPDAGIYVEGDQFWAWMPDTAHRLQGGSIISEKGGRESIADALRRAYPPDDPRWHRTMPKPFWSDPA